MAPRGRDIQGGDFRDNVVKIDVDTPVEYYDPNRVLEDKIKMLKALGYGYTDAYWRYSSSKRHIHIIIKLDREVDIPTLFYLQFVLGDDQKRSMLNFYRLKYFPDKAKYFNVLFEKKVKIGKKKKMKMLVKVLWRKFTRK